MFITVGGRQAQFVIGANIVIEAGEFLYAQTHAFGFFTGTRTDIVAPLDNSNAVPWTEGMLLGASSFPLGRPPASHFLTRYRPNVGESPQGAWLDGERHLLPLRAYTAFNGPAFFGFADLRVQNGTTVPVVTLYGIAFEDRLETLPDFRFIPEPSAAATLFSYVLLIVISRRR